MRIARYVIVFGILLAAPVARAEQTLKVYYDAPRLESVEHRGEPFSFALLQRKIWVASFFYTSCSGPCPMTMANLKRVVHKNRSKKDIAFVSITVDPEKDEKEVLEKYREGLGSSKTDWYFLRTTKEHTKKLMKEGFHIPPGTLPEVHNTNFVLVDQENRIRGYYSGMRSEDVSRLEADIERLRVEAAR